MPKVTHLGFVLNVSRLYWGQNIQKNHMCVTFASTLDVVIVIRGRGAPGLGPIWWTVHEAYNYLPKSIQSSL